MPLVKTLLKDLAEKNYYTAKALWKYRQRTSLRAFEGQPIIDYQMGKVGSSTVHASLRAMDARRPIYHVHFLNPQRVREIEDQRRKYFRTARYSSLRRPWLYEFLYEEIRKSNRHWKIVTLIREPIARNISTFFENLEVKPGTSAGQYRVQSSYYDFDLEVDVTHLDPLIELFFARLPHDRPLNYFDDEVKTVFGIDVFADAFDPEQGYNIFHGEKAELLLIRLEDLDRCAGAAFREFMGIDGFELIQANRSEQKVYAPLYREFKASIRFPESYAERMYESRYARFFYSDEQIRGFREYWRV
ncbi:MAG: putative capsular polysaccharide synthesis family protein [Thiogranum sp.]|nr:putative capsular polysaccharide synthesis family protein [Thiogranum sp.]